MAITINHDATVLAAYRTNIRSLQIHPTALGEICSPPRQEANSHTRQQSEETGNGRGKEQRSTRVHAQCGLRESDTVEKVADSAEEQNADGQIAIELSRDEGEGVDEICF